MLWPIFHVCADTTSASPASRSRTPPPCARWPRLLPHLYAHTHTTHHATATTHHATAASPLYPHAYHTSRHCCRNITPLLPHITPLLPHITPRLPHHATAATHHATAATHHATAVTPCFCHRLGETFSGMTLCQQKEVRAPRTQSGQCGCKSFIARALAWHRPGTRDRGCGAKKVGRLGK